MKFGHELDFVCPWACYGPIGTWEREDETVDLKAKIREIPDFPVPGVSFKDITTLLKDKDALKESIDRLSASFSGKDVDIVVGTEARGFVVGSPVAYLLNAGFVVVRKAGKLPAEVVKVEYDLEYGKDTLEIHKDAIEPGQKVLIVDDVLATGGTMSAAIELVRKLGGEVVGCGFIVELSFLGGRDKLRRIGLADDQIVSLVTY